MKIKKLDILKRAILIALNKNSNPFNMFFEIT
jgi:hypothetical protein